MKKWLSYVWPFTHRVESRYSGMVEITWINGKKVLDTKNANYSYGKLQQVLEFGLSKVGLKGVGNILLLGLGGGSVINSLNGKFGYRGHITAIEMDELIIELAAKEFQISNSEGISVIHTDALAFVYHDTQTYDLLIVDLFIDNKVPGEVYSQDFWHSIVKRLNAKGFVIFNAGIDLSPSPELDALVEGLKNSLDFSRYEKVVGVNTLLIGQKQD